ncbi:MAG TPA: YkgJ family cysteine cluster protein [Thermoanaerobaculia bacterium]|nr:YkgJ family cysteine cluster protein [Thermoanaerobaculia bacterium]
MNLSSMLRTVPAPGTPGAPAAAEEPAMRVINRTVYFSGDCERCRPHCGALCCSDYAVVALTEEEVQSGRYAWRGVTEGCECATCRKMRDLGVRHALLKQADGSCVYLDGSRRCSIYAERPATCRGYTCRSIPFRVSLP